MSDAWDGRPENPERDGWHWVGAADSAVSKEIAPWFWRADKDGWMPAIDVIGFPLISAGRVNWRYLGPCLTPTEVAARLAAAEAAGWKAGVEAAAQRAYEIAENLSPNGADFLAGYANGALDAVRHIRAIPAPDTSALSRLIAEARAQEREACAAYVESVHQWGGHDDYCDSCKNGAIYPDRDHVAAAIRARKDSTP